LPSALRGSAPPLSGKLRRAAADRPAGEGEIVFSFLLWLILFVLCWPIALLALLLWPLVFLISLPFRLLGIAVEGAFELLRAIIMLPARLLRGRPR
jgi:hypothetical protein